MCTKISTAGLSHDDWLRLRKSGIGGSEAAAVCNLNPYSSAMKVFIDKTSENIEYEDNEPLRQGRDLEDYVAQRFTDKTGLKVRRSNYMYRSRQFPWMIADVDRLIIGEDAGLECKTANAYNADKWEGDNIPIHYYIQCQHYMAVTGKKAWYIAVVILGVDFKYKKIERDEELITGLILLEERFWKNHVMAGIMPQADGSKDCDKMLAKMYQCSKKDSRIQLVGFDERLKRRIELDELIKRMDTERNEIDQELKKYLGENEIAENDIYKVSWKGVESVRLDMSLLKEEQPEIYRQYLRPSLSRRFTIKTAA